MRFLADLHTRPLKGLGQAMEVVLNSDLERQFENGHLDRERVRSLLAECAASKIPIEGDVLAYAFKGHLDRLVRPILQSAGGDGFIAEAAGIR